VTTLAIGRLRLKIDIHFEQATRSKVGGDQQQLNRTARELALAERARWELEHLSRSGWLR
jgi:hypothetical protein